jgi:hypothetical protein
MSKADEFRRYADEAMGWARNSTSAKDRSILINLARVWIEAAERHEHAVVAKEIPQPRSAASRAAYA